MKIKINQDLSIQELEVEIHCQKEDEMVGKIVSAIQMVDSKLCCYIGERVHYIDVSCILYIESVDRKTFLYTEEDVFEIDKRLYELEEQLGKFSFFRASKAIIVNLNQVQSLRPEIGARLVLTMENAEKIVVSRQYAKIIKNVLGVK